MEKPIIDILWVVVSAGLVFVMQMGFLCLEAGLTRSKNSINVAIKNLTDFGITVIFFWSFGFALMFGLSKTGWVGLSYFFVSLGPKDPWLSAFFLYQVMFCGTAVTIISGAVAERMRFVSYIIVAIIVSGFIYPLFGHWAWGGAYEGASGWLANMGFIDFAGSTVVHSVGGWSALAILLIIGPRSGRFPKNGVTKIIPGSNLPMAMLGVLLLWFGWIGFNGGSTFAMNNQVPGIIANTILAGGSGLVTALIIGWFIRGYPEASLVMNGSLAGLVAITANCFAVSATASIFIGGIGALVMLAAQHLMERFKIDDVVGAVPVHLAAGVWGTIAVSLFGNPEILATGLSRWGQLKVQLLGIGVCGLIAFGGIYIILVIVNRFFSLRVTADQEYKGLNVAEHRATTEILDLLTVMDYQAKTQDLNLRVPVEPFTEVGQIAKRYNTVMEALEKSITKTEAIVKTSKDGIVTFLKDSLSIISLNPGLENIFGYSTSQLLGQPITSLFESPMGPSNGLSIEDTKRTFPGILLGKISEATGKRADGSLFPMEVTVTEAKAGKQTFCVATLRDITDRKQQENEIKASLKEKEVLLKEIHHRVKNNLQVITSLLNLQSEKIKDKQFLDMFKESQNRVKSMALIHEKLYQSKNLSKINFAEYIQNLISDLFYSYGDQVKDINLKVNVDEVMLNLDTGIPCGLILNELVSNALKHAFPNGKKGEIEIGLRSEGKGKITLAVKDNGVGMPPNLNFKKTESLGLQLVNTLTDQLGGVVTHEKGDGTEFKITFVA